MAMLNNQRVHKTAVSFLKFSWAHPRVFSQDNVKEWDPWILSRDRIRYMRRRSKRQGWQKAEIFFVGPGSGAKRGDGFKSRKSPAED